MTGAAPLAGGDKTTSEALPANALLKRTSAELIRVRSLMTELENNFLDGPPSGASTDSLKVLQNIDLIQQSLNGLAEFLDALGESCGALHIPAARPLSRVTLEKMRHRLRHGNT